MTEAMSRREIEDVLTSIKRLVSQDAKSRPVPAPAAEKLVLTPSLRVKEPVSDVDVANVPVPDAPGDPQAPQAVAPDHAEFVTPNDAPDTMADQLPGRDGSLIRRIAQAGLSRDAIAAEQIVAEQAVMEQAGTEDADAAQESDAVPSEERQVPETPSDILEPQASDTDIEETLARLEAVLSGQTPPERPANPTVSPDPARPDPSAAPAGEQIIDEGMLYQLVAHIVRQELQGELGEKITRNIRKLVRSEVARELQLRRP